VGATQKLRVNERTRWEVSETYGGKLLRFFLFGLLLFLVPIVEERMVSGNMTNLWGNAGSEALEWLSTPTAVT
jgi:hypothetical protein